MSGYQENQGQSPGVEEKHELFHLNLSFYVTNPLCRSKKRLAPFPAQRCIIDNAVIKLTTVTTKRDEKDGLVFGSVLSVAGTTDSLLGGVF